MAGAQQDLDSENTSINITPLVDIILVLLIIFMVTANMQQKKTVDLQLPAAQTGEQIAMKGEPLTLSVAKDSKYFMNGQMVTLQEIEKKVTELKKTGTKFQIFIAADENATHGVVMKLIDTMRANDIYDFSLDVESK